MDYISPWTETWCYFFHAQGQRCSPFSYSSHDLLVVSHGMPPFFINQPPWPVGRLSWDAILQRRLFWRIPILIGFPEVGSFQVCFETPISLPWPRCHHHVSMDHWIFIQYRVKTSRTLNQHRCSSSDTSSIASSSMSSATSLVEISIDETPWIRRWTFESWNTSEPRN